MKYTKEETAQLRKLYAEGVEPAQIGEVLRRSKASVIGKLVKERVYKKKRASTKREGPSKLEVLGQIAELADADFGLLEGMLKSSKDSLQYLLQRLKAELADR